MSNSLHIRSGSIYLISGSLSSSFSESITNSTSSFHEILPSITGSEFIGSIQLDPNDPGSFYISGSNTSASLYMSSSGKLGFGTTNPESEFDIRTDDFKIRKRGIASGIRMNEDGNLESFNNDTTSAATGSEVILKYTRGTSLSVPSGKRKEDLRDVDFYKKTIAQANDTLGSIRWVADSGSLDQRSAGEAGNIKMQVASADATGVTGKLSINLAADPGAASQQLYLVNGATQVHAFTGAATFSSNVTVTGNITANGNIIGDDATDITNIESIFCDNVVHDGDTNNKIAFGTDTQDLQTGGSSRLDISDSGIRLGGANARVTTVLDEDDMSSDSATSLATQQSIKAYVDANAGGSVSGNTFATDLKVGRDADNLIDFTTDNQVTFRVSANDGVIMKASGEIEATSLDISGDVDVDGTLETDALTVGGTNILTGGIVTTLGRMGGAINFNSQNMTNVDIDSGTIDGATIATSDITVGAEKTLDVRSGTFNTSAAQKKTIIEGAASNIDIGAYELRAQTLESDVATGTAPFTVASTTEVANLHSQTATTASFATNFTASGDISSSGNISATGTIRGKQLQVYHANWKDDAGTTEIFIPLAGVPDEQTSGIKEQQAIIMPCSGTVKEIILRMHWTSTITTSDDITWKIYNRPANKKMSGTTELSSFTMTNPTQGATDANNTRSSGILNQAFAEGDALMISMQWASTGPTNSADRMYVTVVVENDWNTVGY